MTWDQLEGRWKEFAGSGKQSLARRSNWSRASKWSSALLEIVESVKTR